MGLVAAIQDRLEPCKQLLVGHGHKAFLIWDPTISQVRIDVGYRGVLRVVGPMHAELVPTFAQHAFSSFVRIKACATAGKLLFAILSVVFQADPEPAGARNSRQLQAHRQRQAQGLCKMGKLAEVEEARARASSLCPGFLLFKLRATPQTLTTLQGLDELLFV